MATSPSSDVDEVRRRSGEAPSTTKPSSPTTTTLNSNAALDALDDDDNVVRSQVVLMLGDAVRDPSPLFDLARQIESEAWRCFALKATVNGNGGSSEIQSQSTDTSGESETQPTFKKRSVERKVGAANFSHDDLRSTGDRFFTRNAS